MKRPHAAVLLVVCLLVLGCRPPSLRDRARQLGSKASTLGSRVVAVVRPVAPKVDVRAVAGDLAKQAVADQLAKQGPITFTKRIGGDRDRTADDDDRREPLPAPAPAERPTFEPTVTKTVHQAPPPSFVLRGQTIGGKRICTTFSSLDECNADCTRQIRQTSQLALTKDPNLTQSCVCTEGGRC